MNIYPRKAKSIPDSYYFGDFDDEPLAPFSVSVASFDESYEAEEQHYHKENQKVYVTLEGEGILNVDGKQIKMVPEQMINIEPGEVHFVERVVKSPLKFVVILSEKINDKVVVD